MLGTTARSEDAIRRSSDQVSTLKMCPTFRELQGLDGDPIDFEWKKFPRIQSIGHVPQNSSRPTRKEHHTWKIQWSNDLHVNVHWTLSWKGKITKILVLFTSRKIKEHASNFNDGHWAFFGPGEESKWYRGYAAEFGGKWDLRASQLWKILRIQDIRYSKRVSPLGRGILKKGNNRETVHFNGEYGNTELPHRTLHAANPLCIYGAVSKWCGPNSGDASQSRPDSVRKMSPEIQMKGRSQVIGGYSKTTACIGKPNAPEFEGFQFDAIYEQNWTSPYNGEILPSDRERKLRCYNCSWWWRINKTHFNVQRIMQRPETKRIHRHTHQLMQKNK